jgi:ribonuclease HI
MKFIVHTDGGSRGNPGKAAIGVVIEKSQILNPNDQSKTELVTEFGKRIGETTNNVAEYCAVLEGLHNIKNQSVNRRTKIKDNDQTDIMIQCYLDSLLVVQQLNGVFKIRDARLRELFFSIKSLEQEIGASITYTHVPREENTRADALVNRALDGLM